MVSQLRPAWAPSRMSISKRCRSLREGTPHSVSWYLISRAFWVAHSHRIFARPDASRSVPAIGLPRVGGARRSDIVTPPLTIDSIGRHLQSAPTPTYERTIGNVGHPVKPHDEDIGFNVALAGR